MSSPVPAADKKKPPPPLEKEEEEEEEENIAPLPKDEAPADEEDERRESDFGIKGRLKKLGAVGMMPGGMMGMGGVSPLLAKKRAKVAKEKAEAREQQEERELKGASAKNTPLASPRGSVSEGEESAANAGDDNKPGAEETEEATRAPGAKVRKGKLSGKYDGLFKGGAGVPMMGMNRGLPPALLEKKRLREAKEEEEKAAAVAAGDSTALDHVKKPSVKKSGHKKKQTHTAFKPAPITEEDPVTAAVVVDRQADDKKESSKDAKKNKDPESADKKTDPKTTTKPKAKAPANKKAKAPPPKAATKARAKKAKVAPPPAKAAPPPAKAAPPTVKAVKAVKAPAKELLPAGKKYTPVEVDVTEFEPTLDESVDILRNDVYRLREMLLVKAQTAKEAEKAKGASAKADHWERPSNYRMKEKEEIYFSGNLSKDGAGALGRSNKKRFIVMYEKRIDYFASPSDNKPKGTIELTSSCSIKQTGENQLEIVSGTGKKNTSKFLAESDEINAQFFAATSNRILALGYVRKCDMFKIQANQHLLNWLKQPRLASPIPLVLSHTELDLNTTSLVAQILGETSCQAVSELQLDNCELTSMEFEVILKGVLRRDEQSVTLINFSGNSLVDDLKAAGEVVGALLQTSTTFTTLLLDHCHLDDRFFAHLEASVEEVKAPLKVLKFVDNQIGDEGVSCLRTATATALATTTECLDLTGNQIGNGGASVLAEALSTSTSLKTVILRDNLIKDVGARNLADSLAHNTTTSVELLDLSLNKQITGAGPTSGAHALSDMARKNHSLKELFFLGHHINLQGLTVMRLLHSYGLAGTPP